MSLSPADFDAKVRASGMVVPPRPATSPTVDDEPRIVLCAWKSANSYPKPANRVAVYLAPLSDALTTRHRTDAHFQPLCTTECRRLDNDAIGLVPIAVVYLTADIDDPIAHRLGTPARKEWREAERPKIERLRAKHPGAIVYETTGGYRIVLRCPPFTIATRQDARAWWVVYGRFVRYLRAEFGIVADPACKNFSRLYRLPRVRRDGVRIDGAVLGDPERIEVFDMSKLPEAPRQVHPYVKQALRNGVQAVRTAQNGVRDEVFNREAWSLAGFISGGHVDEGELRDALFDAAAVSGDNPEKDRATILAAIESGKQHPRDPEKESRSGRGTSSSSGARAQRAPSAAGAAAPEEDERGPREHGRPPIRICADVYAMTSKASDALTGDPHVYQRNGQLVHVTSITHEEVQRSRPVQTDAGPRRELVEGTPRIRIVTFPTLKERLCVVADFQKYDARLEDWRPARPDGDVVAALLARGEWPGVRSLRGIVETPTLRPDGSILQGEPRYDAETGLLYAPNTKFPPVPEKPTKADAEAAYGTLVDVFADFPHDDDKRDAKGLLERAGSHKAVPIAHAMTLVGRAAITNSGIPMSVYDANTRGSGKTLQTDAVALMATGRPMPRMTYPHTDEELEKVLAGYALRGATLLCLDNVTRPLGGGPLDKILTARDLVELRVLATNEIPMLVWLAVSAATGNNVQFQADTARRVLVSRLESLEVRPETRTDFRRADLLGHVAKDRPKLVVALLTILRAYFVAGRPDMGCGTWGSFEAWASLIPQAIVFAGGADPMKARAEADANPEEDSFAAFLDGMRRHLKDGESFTAASVKTWLYPDDSLYKPTDDGARDLREAVETLCGRAPLSAITNVLGLKLRKFRDRVFECGKRRVRLVKAGEKNKSARWTVEEVRNG